MGAKRIRRPMADSPEFLEPRAGLLDVAKEPRCVTGDKLARSVKSHNSEFSNRRRSEIIGADDLHAELGKGPDTATRRFLLIKDVPLVRVTFFSTVSGDIVVGLHGGAAQYAGAAVTPISTGIPATSTVQALGLDANGKLYAGTGQTLYSYAGAWNAVSGFGAHDVRAVAGSNGTVFAATADAGVLSGAISWAPVNAGLLVASAHTE